LTGATHAPYFYVAASQVSDGRLLLEGPDAHHLAVVRRAKPGDRFLAGDGSGGVYEAAIESASPTTINARVIAENHLSPVVPSVTVLQGLAKGEKVDLVVQKLVEIGVDEIAVFMAGRSVPKWDSAKQASSQARWRRIASEAAKQSRRAWLPLVHGPLSMDEAARLSQRSQLSLVAEPGAKIKLREAIEQDSVSSVALTVGPEGGLSEEEVEAFVALGSRPVSLGTQIMRTETAALVMASLVMFGLGRLG